MASMARVRVVLAGWAGGPGLATHYFLNAASPTGTLEEMSQECCDRVQAAWVLMQNVEPNIWTATTQPTVDWINPENGEMTTSATVTAPAVVSGIEGTKFGPEASGICVNWLTNDFVSGRRVRGRTFISPTNDGIDANGTPTAPHIAAVGNMFAALSDSTSGYPEFCVWHRPVGGSGGSAHLVTGSRVRDTGSVLTSRRA